jgi:hypothetical protein
MFKAYIGAAIDTIQSTKKIAIDTFVKHEGLSDTLNKFVDTQTEYTKQAIDASVEAGTNMYKTLTDKTFYTDTLEAFKASFTQKKGK